MRERGNEPLWRVIECVFGVLNKRVYTWIEVYVQVCVSVWGWEASLIKRVGTKMFLKVY